MAQFNATIESAKRDPRNAANTILRTSEGHTLYLPEKYVIKVLKGAYLDDVRVTAIQGAEVEYDMKKYKAGDLVFDNKGVVAKGEKTAFKLDGQRPINLQFGNIDGHITDYDKAKMTASAIGDAQVKVASLFGNKAKKAVVATPEVVAEAPKPKVEEPAKEKVEEGDVS